MLGDEYINNEPDGLTRYQKSLIDEWESDKADGSPYLEQLEALMQKTGLRWSGTKWVPEDRI